jgi:aromatase
VTSYASHSIVCQAPAQVIYELISQSCQWPHILQLCEKVEVIESGPDRELVEISARIHGQLTSWQSERHRVPEVLGVETRMVRPMPLVARMHTSWRVFDLGAGASLLVLEHDYDLKKDVAGAVEGVSTAEQAERYISAAIDANSGRELADFKAAAEASAPPERDVEWARHSVVCDAEVDDVYERIRDTTEWPQMFEACVGTTVKQRDGNREVVTVHATQAGQIVSWDTERRYHDSIHRIDYRLLVPMPFVASMSGQWRVIPLQPGRCLLTVDRAWRILDDVGGIREDIHTRPQAAAFVRGYVENNAGAEMEAISAYLSRRVLEPSGVDLS